MRCIRYGRLKKKERGSAIIECMIAMLLMLLVLFGLLQLFQLSAARAVSDYSSFRAARSSAVGFNEYLVDREARVKSIPVSGDLIYPLKKDIGDNEYARFAAEKVMIEEYMDGTRKLEYEYWFGADPVRHNNYKCPDYGDDIVSGTCPVCGVTGAKNSSLSVSDSILNERVKVTFRFNSYPFRMPMYKAFMNSDSMDITSETELANHASAFLE